MVLSRAEGGEFEALKAALVLIRGCEQEPPAQLPAAARCLARATQPDCSALEALLRWAKTPELNNEMYQPRFTSQCIET